MTLGESIKAQRKIIGLTQRQLAARCEIGYPYMSKIENDRERPNPGVLERLAEVLDMDYYLLALTAGFVPKSVLEAMQQHPKQTVAIWRKFANHDSGD